MTIPTNVSFLKLGNFDSANAHPTEMFLPLDLIYIGLNLGNFWNLIEYETYNKKNICVTDPKRISEIRSKML